MKKNTHLLVFIFVLLLQNVFAQRDTVMVPSDINGDPYGAFNKFILGDTTADGARNNPLRVYRLERNKIYFLNGTFQADFDLNLWALPADDDHKPPIITSGLGQDGSVVAQHIKCEKDGVFKNIYIQTTPPTNLGAGVVPVDLLGDGHTYIFDNVTVEWGNWLSVKVEAENTEVIIRNCYFRNCENPNSAWNGRGIDFRDHHVNKLVMVNNSFFNVNSFVLRGERCTIDSVHFEHNTIVNSIKWPIQWRYQSNAIVKNNLFYNVHSYSEVGTDFDGQDVDGLLFGIYNLEYLPSDILTELDITESDRVINFNNNSWFYSSEITDYWNALSLPPEPLFNTRTQAIFDDDATYPHITADNTYNLDPGFVNAGDVSSMVQWMTDLRAGSGTTYWGYDPDNNRFMVTWPLPEDLSYSNATLLTGGDDGLPVGDLNWFPAEKAVWDAANPWDDELVGVNILPEPNTYFELSQNQPNPFTNETVISYVVSKAADISLTVYDVLGNRVGTLMTGQHHAPGKYSIVLDVNKDLKTNIASGVFYYEMKAGDASTMRKMIILK